MLPERKEGGKEAKREGMMPSLNPQLIYERVSCSTSAERTNLDTTTFLTRE